MTSSGGEVELSEAEEAFLEEVDREIRKLRACYSRLLKASHIRTMESLEVDNMQISSNVMKIMASSQALLKHIHRLKANLLLHKSKALDEQISRQNEELRLETEQAIADANALLGGA
uniref:Uncharacterized protein n=1 Tax=Pinguiococcus pyrenoidosus TaxID=172671 RepID=A0A7R9YEH4_9STRA|mmetsp:Transcript_5982/g.23234  ORF Transcript_5982/g.23234 Transcript_5982/m.23234 type:complete len:117 (+) Transcript_5982:108-458(+)